MFCNFFWIQTNTFTKWKKKSKLQWIITAITSEESYIYRRKLYIALVTNNTVVRLKQCFLFENKRQHKNRSLISDMVRAKSDQQTPKLDKLRTKSEPVSARGNSNTEPCLSELWFTSIGRLPYFTSCFESSSDVWLTFEWFPAVFTSLPEPSETPFFDCS